MQPPLHAFAVAAPGHLPCGSTWLSWVLASGTGPTITTVGGESITLGLTTGMYPIRAAAVTSLGAATNVVAWWT